MSSTREIFYMVADEMKVNRQQVQEFINVLEKNWYRTRDELRTLKLHEFDQFGIPRRLTNMIMGKIGSNQQAMKSMEMDIQISLPQLIQSLRNRVSKSAFEDMINTLWKIFHNIRDQITEEKFRVLKKTNKKIAELLSIRQNYQFIKYGGFEQHQATFVMMNINLGRIDECLEELSKHQTSVKFDPYKVHITNKNDNAKAMNQIGGETSYVFNQKLKELEDQRNRIMSRPLKDRRIQIYVEEKKKDTVRSWEDDRDETAEEREFAVSLKEKLMHFNEDPQFMNRRKQEYFDLLKKPVFSETLIRVKLPSRYIFQCRFSPNETLGDLVKIFHEYIENKNLPYYLYMTPPVQRLEGKILRQTFYEKDCVPSGLFYFGSDEKIEGNIMRKKTASFIVI